MAKSRAKTSINLRVGREYSLRKAVAGVDLARRDGENQLIKIYSMPPERTGVHYEGNPNPSSAPGEAPAPQSGLLRQGVASTPPTLKGQTVSATVASRGAQAAALEFGTEDGRIEPRPAVQRLETEEPRRRRLFEIFKIGARRVG